MSEPLPKLPQEGFLPPGMPAPRVRPEEFPEEVERFMLQIKSVNTTRWNGYNHKKKESNSTHFKGKEEINEMNSLIIPPVRFRQLPIAKLVHLPEI